MARRPTRLRPAASAPDRLGRHRGVWLEPGYFPGAHPQPSQHPPSLSEHQATTPLDDQLLDHTSGVTESVEHRVRFAGPQDRARVVDVLTAAFMDDPLFGHLLPPSMPRREARLRKTFELEVSRSQRRGGMWVAGDGAGVMVCFPPGRWQTTTWEDFRDAARWRYIFGRHLNTASSAIARMEAEQRSLPDHWFLCYAAVDPMQQNSGIGTALLAAVLEECDRTGTPAFTEASNDKSHALASRYGFVDRPSFSLPQGGPTVFPMWREPC
jgi:GNAT superfamily N-acetyltransferase